MIDKTTSRGFTLIEMLVSLMIVGLLATLLIGQLPQWQAASERPVCVGNIRSIHTALALYLQDHGSWPQVPADVQIDSSAEYNFWIQTLAPYGIVQRNWHCPTLDRTIKDKNLDAGEHIIHYVPSIFDSKPFTPYAWPNMPWVTEIGNLHGKGTLISLPDGSIRNFADLYPDIPFAPIP